MLGEDARDEPPAVRGEVYDTRPTVGRVRATLDEVLDASSLATQMLLDANTAEFNYLLLLADLERVTAGGICPNYLPPSDGTDAGSANPAPPAPPEDRP